MHTLQQFWPVPGPWEVTVTRAGANNETYNVQTPAGPHVLRIYRNHANLGRVRYELAVLDYLQRSHLPFAVPAPVAAVTGDLLVRLPEEGAPVATLVPLIPGAHPTRGDLAQAHAGGQALGHLVATLSNCAVQPEVPVPAYGNLSDIHPLVPNPLAALADLPATPEKLQRLSRLCQHLLEHVPQIYRSLPRQIIHGDYTRWNVLLEDATVTGVLDFEFACMDVRPMDVAIGPGAWPGGLWSTGDEWAVLEAFGRGYLSAHPLESEEIEALPFLMRLRRGATLLHYLGRHRQGLETNEGLLWHVDWVLEMEDWLEQNAGEFLRRVHNWRSM